MNNIIHIILPHIFTFKIIVMEKKVIWYSRKNEGKSILFMKEIVSHVLGTPKLNNFLAVAHSRI